MEGIYENMNLSPAPLSVGLSAWEGWDQSNLPWSETKHKDFVCFAVFGKTWSMEDAAVLIGFIDGTWRVKANG